jgi:hypothetical protein
MHHRLSSTDAALILTFACAASAHAQAVPTRTLKEPTVEYEESFSQLSALRELRDGRVVVADPRERTLQVIDLKGSGATPIGREGAGPLEWGSLNALLPWRGDSTLLSDMRNSRFLVLGPDGKPVRTYSPTMDAAVSANPNGGTGGVRISGGGPVSARGSDAQGRLYYQALAFAMGPNGPVRGDSAAIVRFDPNTQKHDTLAYLNLPQANTSTQTQGSGGRTTVAMISMPKPFNPADEWRVTPDGRVVIARVADYHLEIVHPDGRRIVGPANKFAPVAVTQKDKDAFIAASSAGRPMVVANGRTVDVPPPAAPTEWPSHKPSFPSGALAIAPNGEAWVFRSRAAADEVPVADVFDAQGRLTGRVALPAKSRFVGFGARGVYVARVDEDDLLYLQLHAMPWTGCPAAIREVCTPR